MDQVKDPLNGKAFSERLLSKETAIATAIGAGLGALQGNQNNKLLATTLWGAGLGAAVGILGESLLTSVFHTEGKSEPPVSTPNTTLNTTSSSTNNE